MASELTWHGHATWMIQTGSHRVLLDPFFDDSPAATLKANQVEADYILVSHGHFDHIADAAPIAKRCGATVVAIFEIANWLADKHGVQNTVGMNIGGQTVQPFGTVKMTQAIHSSQLPDGAYGGEPAGFVLTIDGKRLYFACDTSLFSDMKMIGNGGLDSAAVPIGDLFTMGPNDSVEATKLLNPSVVFPQHYNTWPPIEQDAAAWAEMIRGQTNATPVVLQPGQSYSMD